MTCHACGFETDADLCHFCRRTVELIRARLCVSCKAPVNDVDSERMEGRCGECRSRNVVVSKGTRRLLVLRSKVRYNHRAAA